MIKSRALLDEFGTLLIHFKGSHKCFGYNYEILDHMFLSMYKADHAKFFILASNETQALCK